MAVILVLELMQWHDAVGLLADHDLLYHWPLATVSKVTAMLPDDQYCSELWGLAGQEANLILCHKSAWLAELATSLAPDTSNCRLPD
jgi:hypothetical protein